MDPKIELSFGGHSGLKGFDELWTNKAESGMRSHRSQNGGRLSGKNEVRKTSYGSLLFTDMPEDLDLFEYNAIFGKER